MSASEIHKYGTDDGWHGKIKDGGEFPPEKDRYHLYIGTPYLLSHPGSPS
jgi:putative glutathione S-transferase